MTVSSGSATLMRGPITAAQEALSRVAVAVVLLSLMFLLFSALLVGPLVYQLRARLSQHPIRAFLTNPR
jgi:hypothetical protein